MLSLLYRMVGAVVLGAAIVTFAVGFFYIFFFVMIFCGASMMALDSLGLKYETPPHITGSLVLEKIGKFVVLLALSPLWLPFYLLKYGYYGLRAVLRYQADRRRRAERREAIVQSERQSRLEADNRARRDDLLFSCDLFFSAHADQLEGHFSKEELDRFVKRYMGETETRETLRRRSRELIALIRRKAESADPPERRGSLEQLTQWYTEQKADIERLPLDEFFKQDFVVQLNERYAELCQKFLSRATF